MHLRPRHCAFLMTETPLLPLYVFTFTPNYTPRLATTTFNAPTCTFIFQHLPQPLRDHHEATIPKCHQNCIINTLVASHRPFQTRCSPAPLKTVTHLTSNVLKPPLSLPKLHYHGWLPSLSSTIAKGRRKTPSCFA